MTRIKPRPWTPEDDAELRRAYLANSASEVGRLMGRSRVAIRNRVHKLGIRKGTTEAPINMMRDALRTAKGVGVDIEALKTLARDVINWGNCDKAWSDHSEDEPAAVVGHITEDGEKYPVTIVDCDQYYAASDSIKLARFYAAANPAKVLELISLIEGQK